MPNENGVGASIMEQKEKKKREKEASDASKSKINIEKLKYDSIPFKNIDIDRMNK